MTRLVANRAVGSAPKGGCTTPIGELTKEKLYREAWRLHIKGRSKMNKSQLKSAIARHRHV